MSNWLEIRGTLCAYKYLQLETIDSGVRVNFDPTIILTGMAFDPCWAMKSESPNFYIERVSESVLSLKWSMIREQTPGWHPSHPAITPNEKTIRSCFFPTSKQSQKQKFVQTISWGHVFFHSCPPPPSADSVWKQVDYLQGDRSLFYDIQKSRFQADHFF